LVIKLSAYIKQQVLSYRLEVKTRVTYIGDAGFFPFIVELLTGRELKKFNFLNKVYYFSSLISFLPKVKLAKIHTINFVTH